MPRLAVCGEDRRLRLFSRELIHTWFLIGRGVFPFRFVKRSATVLGYAAPKTSALHPDG
jgi:hypothetical protein